MPPLSTKATVGIPTIPTRPIQSRLLEEKRFEYRPWKTGEVIYPRVQLHYCFSGVDTPEFSDIPQSYRPGPVTENRAKELMGWMNQAEWTSYCLKDQDYKARDSKGELLDKPTESQIVNSTLFANHPHLSITLIDYDNEPIICIRNECNRRFREGDCKKLVKSILERVWAGPICFPGETINGEAILISRYGDILSGQHRLIALIIACQIWRKSGGKHGPWGKFWKTAPVLETTITYGVSADPRVLMTIDATVPRDGADTIFTSEVFKDIKTEKRVKLSSMLDRAIDLLWKRTGMSNKDTVTTNIRTNPETMTFLRNHPYLEKCVRRIFEEDRQRALSKLHISPGQCSALLYLMSASATEPEKAAAYREQNPRKEEAITFQNKELATQFWTQFARQSAKDTSPIAQALQKIPVDEKGAMAQVGEKLAIICKAWRLYVEGESITVESCSLNRHEPLLPNDDYIIDSSNQFRLKSEFDFGGIDTGNVVKRKKVKAELTEQDKSSLAARKEKEDKERLEIERRKQEERKKQMEARESGTMTEQQRKESKLKLLRASNPNTVLLFMQPNDTLVAYTDDAVFLTEKFAVGFKAGSEQGLKIATLPGDQASAVIGKITGKGYKVGIISMDGKTITKHEAKPAPAKPAEPKVKGKKPPLRGGIG